MMTKNLPQPRKGVDDKYLVRPGWSTQGARPKDAIWLDRNENLDPELATVTAKVVGALGPEALNTYPDLRDLYAQLAEVLGVEPDQIALAAGSDGAIRAVYEAFVAPGDVVVHSNPTFAMYLVYARMYGADARPFDYVASEHGPYLDVDQLIGTIETVCPRLVCLPNPDSPSGTVVEDVDLKRIVDAAGAAGAVMLVDEAYYPFYPHSVVSWVDENPHLVVTRSFGKAWGLAGVRAGVAIAHPDMAVILNKVRPMYEIGALSAHVLERMLAFEPEVAASVQRNLDGKSQFADAMRALGFDVLTTHGNFLHVAFGVRADIVHKALKGRVLYREDFPNTALSGYSRFSVAPWSIMKVVSDMIRSVVENA